MPIELYDMVILLYFLQLLQNDFLSRNLLVEKLLKKELFENAVFVRSAHRLARTRANPFLEYINNLSERLTFPVPYATLSADWPTTTGERF